MRVSGSFSKVFEGAREFMADSSDKPMDPKVKYDSDSDVWMIESGYDSNPENGVVVDFDDFCAYWYEGINDVDYMPTESDITDYLKMMSDEN